MPDGNAVDALQITAALLAQRQDQHVGLLIHTALGALRPACKRVDQSNARHGCQHGAQARLHQEQIIDHLHANTHTAHSLAIHARFSHTPSIADAPATGRGIRKPGTFPIQNCVFGPYKIWNFSHVQALNIGLYLASITIDSGAEAKREQTGKAQNGEARPILGRPIVSHRIKPAHGPSLDESR